MSKNSPRIILFDLETLPNLPEAMKVWPQLSDYPFQTMKATITTVICAGWKVLGQKQTHCINAWDFSAWKKNINDDYHVCKAIYDVLRGADAVVTHNGIRFDWKFLQTRLMFHNLDTLDKIPHIDTVMLARANLLSFNNRLGTLAKWLVGDNKMSHEGWDLWDKVYKKDPRAMRKMTAYCKKDVIVLEKIFLKLRRFAKNIPNHALISGKKVCSTCGGRLKSCGIRRTKTRVYRNYRCIDCRTYCSTDLKDRLPRTH